MGTFSELSDQEININPADYLFKDQKPPNEVLCITINDKKIGSLGNIVTIQGKPKSRKTVFITGMIASFISGFPVYNMACTLPDGCRMAWIDTEQSKYDLYKCVQFVKKETEYKKLPDTISVYQNRPLNPAENRLFLQKLVASDAKLKIIFIDGLLDFVNDMNNIEECTGLIQEIQQLIFNRDILIITVLHENKGSNFSLGHLGSFLERKSQSVLRVEKTAAGSTLEPVYLRSDQDFTPVQIYWNFAKNQYETETNIFRTDIKNPALYRLDELKNIAAKIFVDHICADENLIEQIIYSMFAGSSKKFVANLLALLTLNKFVEKKDGLYTLTML